MRGFVSPGELLTIDAEARARRLRLCRHQGQDSHRQGKLKCSAELTFGLVPFPDPALRVHMDAMANKIGFPLQAITHD